MAEWKGRWTCNLEIPGSSPQPCYSFDLEHPEFYLSALLCK